jgi:hypothetical protein
MHERWTTHQTVARQVVFLLPLLLVTSFWLRSYYVYEAVGRTVSLPDDPAPHLVRTRVWTVTLNQGSSFLTYASYYWEPPHPKLRASAPQYFRHTGAARLSRLTDDPAQSYVSALGFARHQSAGMDSADLSAPHSREEMLLYMQRRPPPRLIYRHWSRTVFQVPLWFIAGLAAVPAAIGLRSCWRRSRAQYRTKRGLCARCGYDLRASAGQCPECGAQCATSSVRGPNVQTTR